MDLFDFVLIETLVGFGRVLAQARERNEQEENNRIIPSWLFREESRQANLPTRLDLPEPVPPPRQTYVPPRLNLVEPLPIPSAWTQPIQSRQENLPTRLDLPEPAPPSAWTPLIPFWLFQNDEENEIEDLRRQNQFLNSISTDQLNGLLVDFDRVFRGRSRQGRCWCVFCREIGTVKFTDTKEKLIDEGRNTECPIAYEEIKYGDSYLSCDTCKYNFSESAILKHLNESRKRDCPMCRAEWKNYCKYINKDFQREMKELKNIFDSFENKNLIENYTNKKIISDIVEKTIIIKHNKRWYYGK